MNGIRPQEILDVLELLRALESAAGQGTRTILATFVTLDGSVFGRAGAMAVFVPTAGFAGGGIIPFTELKGDLRRELDAAAASGRPRLAAVDLAEDDPVLGFGLGAPGRVEVFLEPVDSRLREHIEAVRQALLRDEGVVCRLELEGPEAGRRSLLRSDEAEVKECYQENSPELLETSVQGQVQRVFLCPVHPMGKVLVFGSGPVAEALCRHLCGLGFSVWASDPRPGRLKGPEWEIPGLRFVEGGWEQARAAAQPDEQTSVAVLTRSYALDLETLQGALKSPASYVGLIGPEKRTARLLCELAALGAQPRPGVFFAPAGLDIGAEAAAETALSIAAEILAARSGRKGGRLSSRAAGGAAPRPRIPGIILAAGPGTRFVGAAKLSAPLAGKALLRHVVDNALATRLDPVVVVLGCQASQGLEALSGIKDTRLRVVCNPAWQGGAASSLEVGLRELPHGAAGAVRLLADMPMVKPWLIERVLAELEASSRLVFPVFEGPEGPQAGEPLGIPRRLFAQVKELEENGLAEHWSEAVKVPLADGRTQADVDTAADLAGLAGAL